MDIHLEIFNTLAQRGSGSVSHGMLQEIGLSEEVLHSQFKTNPIDKEDFMDNIERVLTESGLDKEVVLKELQLQGDSKAQALRNLIQSDAKSSSKATSTGVPSNRSSVASERLPVVPQTPKGASSKPFATPPSQAASSPPPAFLPTTTNLHPNDNTIREQSIAQLDRGVSQARDSDSTMEVQYLIIQEEVRRDVIINGEDHDRKRVLYQKWQTCGVPLTANPHSPIATSLGLGRTWDLEWSERTVRKAREAVESCERDELTLRTRLFLRWFDEFTVITNVARPIWKVSQATPPRYRSNRWSEEYNLTTTPPLSGLMLAALSASPATVRASSFSYNESNQMIDNNAVLNIGQSPFAPRSWATYEAPEPHISAISPPRKRRMPQLFNEVSSKLSVGTMCRIADNLQPPSTVTTHRWS